jgi:hypothetical protein
MIVQLKVISIPLSGFGNFDHFNKYNSKPFSIFAKSVNLTESLASLEYQLKEINHIVQRIANIVITTISSTNVKAFIFCLFINFKCLNYQFLNYKHN